MTVGVGMMDPNGWHGHAMPDVAIYTYYLTKMLQFVTALLDAGYAIMLLIGESADVRAVLDLITFRNSVVVPPRPTAAGG